MNRPSDKGLGLIKSKAFQKLADHGKRESDFLSHQISTSHGLSTRIRCIKTPN